MVRKLLITLLMITTISLTSNSQVLDIVNAVTSTFLPKVIDGIKAIKDSGNGDSKKITVKREQFDSTVKELNNYMNGITAAISKDAQSLKVIADVSSNSCSLYDNLGAMYSMSNANLIEKIIGCHSDDVQRSYAQAFYRDLMQLQQDIGKFSMEITNAATIDQSLKDDLAQQIKKINTDYTDLKSHLATSGIEVPTQNSKPDEIANYLKKIKEAGSNLNGLRSSIENILSIFGARLGTYIVTAGNTKSDVDAKFKKLTSNGD